MSSQGGTGGFFLATMKGTLATVVLRAPQQSPAAALGLRAGSPSVHAPAEILRSSAPGQPRGHKSPRPVTDRVSGRNACIRTGTL